MLFLLAENTAEQIGAFLSKDIHPRKPWDVFPELFKEEAELYQRAEQERQVRQMVENRKAYAAELKRRRETAGLS